MYFSQFSLTLSIFLLSFACSQSRSSSRVHRPQSHLLEKLYSTSDVPRHLSIIPLKDFHLFKITESIINLYLKKIYNSTILNM